MKRILLFLVIVAIPSLSFATVYGQQWPWTPLGDGKTYQCVIGATTSINASTYCLSRPLAISGDIGNIGMLIRPGTALVTSCTSGLFSGVTKGATVSFNLFPRTSNLYEWYKHNYHEEAKAVPMYVPIGATSITYKQINAITQFTNYGMYNIEIPKARYTWYLVLLFQIDTGTTLLNRDGLTVEVFLNTE